MVEAQRPVRPLVSIIMPTFNRREYLRAAIESVRAQTLRDWELLIADDGSDAETRFYMRTLQDLAGINILWLAHSGNPPLVRNAALREARGEYVAFLDSDDRWRPRKLAWQVASLRSRPEYGWSYTGFSLIDGNGRPLDPKRARSCPAIRGALLEPLIKDEAVVMQSSVLARRDLLVRLGGYDETLRVCGDYELWTRLARVAQADFCHAPLVEVRRHREHYADDITALLDFAGALDKVRESGVSPQMTHVLKRRRAETAANIARRYALEKRRSLAAQVLWSSIGHGWAHWVWWSRAFEAMARALTPMQAQNTLRRCRDSLNATRFTGKSN